MWDTLKQLVADFWYFVGSALLIWFVATDSMDWLAESIDWLIDLLGGS
jgi:type IV secretory pathway TrbD component